MRDYITFLTGFSCGVLLLFILIKYTNETIKLIESGRELCEIKLHEAGLDQLVKCEIESVKFKVVNNAS